MVKKCCVCSRVKLEGRWRSGTFSFAEGRITHAYCPACFSKTMARISKHASEKIKRERETDLGGVLYRN